MKEISFRDDILPLKDRLFRLALRITLNRNDAEDVVQETLIRMWNKRGEWEQMDSIEAYALTICKNLALDLNAKSERQNVGLDESRDESPSERTPYEELDSKQRLEIVRRLIDGLPETQRAIMELRDVEGKSYKEIAEVMQLSEEQVKVYLFRARQKVKVQFSKIEGYGL